MRIKVVTEDKSRVDYLEFVALPRPGDFIETVRARFSVEKVVWTLPEGKPAIYIRQEVQS